VDDLTKEFLSEANESLLDLDSQLVELETNPNNPDLINNIFRVMHTIKGTCGFIGLSRLEKLAHVTENLLDKFRDGAEVTSGAVTVILSAIDSIKDIVQSIEDNDGIEPEGNDAMIIDLLSDLTNNAKSEISSDTPEEQEVLESEEVLDKTDTEVKSHKNKKEDSKEVDVKNINKTDKKQNTEVSPKDNNKPPQSSNQTVRISVDLLDGLMDLVGELVLSRNQIQQIERNINMSELSVPVQNLSHVASELQESVMKTRMQPIGVAFKAYPRIIRDLAAELGKKIQLVQIGEETEMDRQILELIKDPLTHMVRNCADHALEAPEERLENGKNEVGTVTLQAFHEGGHIIIKIIDDGRGISVNKVAGKALEREIINEQQLESMSDNQIRSLIFNAGFSTAESVTSVSGRGVGMDVVKTNIEKIGGTISVESEEGIGTEFIIKIPLTLAIVSAFIVKSGDQKFAIPQINVMEIVNLDQNNITHKIERINNIPMLRLREKIYPVISLSSVMETEPEGEYTVLVCQVGSEIFGILVDGVLDTEEIVVKPLSRALKDLDLYSGNTILGDGSVIMILDPNGLFNTFGVTSKTDTTDLIQEHSVDNNNDVIQMLVFKAGGTLNKAVHLAVVARLEQIATENMIKNSNGEYLVQYRDELMPIVCTEGWAINNEKRYQDIIVFMDGNKSMGLAVDSIEEIVETNVKIDISSEDKGIIGNAIIAEKPTEILDVSYYLQRAFGDWFKHTNANKYGLEKDYTILLVDDSQFFRNMLKPLITSRGYNVITVENPIEGFQILESEKIDVLISDIEMPEMDGIEFIKKLRADKRYTSLNAVAVSSHATDEDIKYGIEAGFNQYMPKMDKDNLFKYIKSVTVDNNYTE
jgi:two-component system chemotaxis sensor kinase CheA